jgi:hypothetical protein
MKARYGIGGTFARATAVALLLIAIGGSNASANFGGPPPTEYVGACKKGSFATIGAAIIAAPAGATILVCPGIYPEQLTINKSLTIEGIQSGNNDAAIITGTSAINAADFDNGGSPIITQILVENTSNVNLSNLTADGSSNTINGCGTDLIGILFQNASGTINSVAVRNEATAPAYAGCQGGQGIFVETGNGSTPSRQQSIVTITNTSVHDFDKNGITGDDSGTYLYVGNSSIVGFGANPYSGAQNGIQIAYGASGSLYNNNLANFIWQPDVFGDTGDAATGILIYASSNVQVIQNVVTNSQFSIFVGSGTGGFENGSADGTVITGNTISASHLYDGIDLCSNGNFVNSNQIFASDESAIHLDDTCPGSGFDANSGSHNIVTGNTINEACIGVMSGTNASGNIVNNNLSNVVNLALTAETPATPTPFCAPPSSTFNP